MKQLLFIVFVFIGTFVYVGCNEEDYAINRIASPENLSATRGDTSVFLT